MEGFWLLHEWGSAVGSGPQIPLAHKEWVSRKKTVQFIHGPGYLQGKEQPWAGRGG